MGRRVATGFLLLAVILGGGSGIAASEPNQAALVVQFGDGRVETRCITFEEDEIRGTDLLDRSGFEMVVDVSSGMGVTVCQIEGEGCVFPAEHCFCQCMGGGECAYWNYFFRDAGEGPWNYSALGAALRKIGDGSVEAWVWGDGRTPPAEELTFDRICALSTSEPTQESPAEVETPILETPTVVAPTTTPAPVKTEAAVLPATTVPTMTVPPPGPTPAPAPENTASLADYWPFGLMILGLATVGALVWYRRR